LLILEYLFISASTSMGTKKGRHSEGRHRRLGGSCLKLPPWIRHCFIPCGKKHEWKGNIVDNEAQF